MIDELVEQMREQAEAERARFEETGQPGDSEDSHDPESAETLYGAETLPGSEFLSREYPPIRPLIGSPDNAFLVPGEGGNFIGPGGIGKTNIITDLALTVACGYSFLKYHVDRPVVSAILQAELPCSMFQLKLQQMYNRFFEADADRAEAAIKRIHVITMKWVPDLATAPGRQLLASIYDTCGADLFFVDPYLSFFPNTNENDNGAVRGVLDAIKYEVLIPKNCGMILTDHQAKAACTTEGAENFARGAGAKRDWAATSCVLKREKTPEGEHGQFLSLTVDKLRYGPKPRDPFMLKRDEYSMCHSLWQKDSISLDRVARLVDEMGGDLSKKTLKEALNKECSVSLHDAASLIEGAVEDGWLVVQEGARRAKVHNVGPRYEEFFQGEADA